MAVFMYMSSLWSGILFQINICNEGKFLLGFSQEGKRVYFVKRVKLLLYWKGLQSSHTILGQLSRAFQLDGLVGIAMESVIAGARMECAASFCCVVHPLIGILPLLPTLAITVWTSGIILFWSLIVIFHPLGRDYSIIGELTVAWNIGLPSFRKLSFG